MSARGEQARSAGVRAAEQIRNMLLNMELLPGQAVRQESIAVRLGMSRAPIREALSILQSEGVLSHAPNAGYTVKRLTATELNQAYLVRRVLETELIRALPKFSAKQMKELTSLHERLIDAAEQIDIQTLRRLNHEFHFAIFNASKMSLVVQEIDRVWTLTDAYRSIYLYDQAARERVIAEHSSIIDAIRAHDLKELETLMNTHRAETPVHLAAMLGGGATPSIA